jgi:hypothetical protein
VVLQQKAKTLGSAADLVPGEASIDTLRGQSLTRLAAEFVVIVIGVLTALAVDQIMEERQERVLERELLLGFVENLRTDSIDFARLPAVADRRVASAELLLLNLVPESMLDADMAETLASLGPYEVPAGDERIVDAWRALFDPSDLDVARGSYTEFSAGGAQRLVQDRDLRRDIHSYYYTVELMQKWDPWVTGAIDKLADLAIQTGLSPGETSAEEIRAAFESNQGSYAAALRYLQSRSRVQSGITNRLSRRVSNLLEGIRAALGG